jgi:hypothetical protein
MPEEAEEEDETLIQNVHLPGLLNLRTPEHKAGVLTTHLRRLVEALSP